MDYDLLSRRDDLSRDLRLRREIDEATPSVATGGLIIGAAVLLMLGLVYFGPPAAERTAVALGENVEAPATTSSQNSP